MKKPYWYKFWWRECPVCGRSDNYKERQYIPKPLKPEDRHVYEQKYDDCLQ